MAFLIAVTKNMSEVTLYVMREVCRCLLLLYTVRSMINDYDQIISLTA